ncbi:MAG TPA: hypothetical protein VK724_17995 [Bryobacteraceae bacterium]|jgi:hypothetical protein|nr:hypothetical protein [Bryobacteraceae bacterium]
MYALPETIDAGLAGEDDSRSEFMRLKYTPQPKCLLPESVRHAGGVGPDVALDEFSGKLLVVTLGINAVVERTGLTISVWGSPDQVEWGAKPLVTLRQRQYCGVYSGLLNLAQRPEVRFLRVHWDMSRWGKGERVAQFGFQVFLEESGARISSSASA